MIEFKVYPGRRNRMASERSLYFTVVICDSKRAMRKRFRELNCGWEEKNDRFGAVVMPMTTMKLFARKWLAAPCLGYALFSKTQLDSETISHEASHMGVAYLRRTNSKALPRKDGFQGDEESLPYAIGNCCRQVLTAANRAGLLNPLVIG